MTISNPAFNNIPYQQLLRPEFNGNFLGPAPMAQSEFAQNDFSGLSSRGQNVSWSFQLLQQIECLLSGFGNFANPMLGNQFSQPDDFQHMLAGGMRQFNNGNSVGAANWQGQPVNGNAFSGGAPKMQAAPKNNQQFLSELDNAFTSQPTQEPAKDAGVGAWADYWTMKSSSPEELAAKRQKLDKARAASGGKMTKQLWEAMPWSAKTAYQADTVKASTVRNGMVELSKDGNVYNQSGGGSGVGKLTYFKADDLNLVAEQKTNHTPGANSRLAYVDESKLRVGNDMVVFEQKDRRVSINGQEVEVGPEGVQLANGSKLKRTEDGGYQVSTQNYNLKVKYWFDSETGVPHDGLTNLTNFQNFEVENKNGGPVQASGLLGDVLTQQSLAGPERALQNRSEDWMSDLRPYYAPDFDAPRV